MKQKNIQQISKLLEEIDKNIHNTKPMMHMIGEKTINKTKESFIKESDPITGRKWSPIAAATLFAQTGGKRKSKIKSGKRHTKGFLKKVGNKKILRDSGDLQDKSIDYIATKNSVTIVAAKEYAATHQFGDKKRNITQRRYLPFDDNMDIEKELGNNIIEELRDFIFS